eukprot:4573282-Amphidinium_carterae.1
MPLLDETPGIEPALLHAGHSSANCMTAQCAPAVQQPHRTSADSPRAPRDTPQLQEPCQWNDKGWQRAV